MTATENPLTNPDVLELIAEMLGGDAAASWYSGSSPPKNSGNNFFFTPVSRSFRAAWGMRSPYTAITPFTTETQLLAALDNGLSSLSIDVAGYFYAKLGDHYRLRVLQSRGYQLDSSTCKAAAHGGQTAMLVDLRSVGCNCRTRWAPATPSVPPGPALPVVG